MREYWKKVFLLQADSKWLYVFMMFTETNESHNLFPMQLPLDINWHFIGHLQSNKVKSLLGINSYVIYFEFCLFTFNSFVLKLICLFLLVIIMHI